MKSEKAQLKKSQLFLCLCLFINAADKGQS